jgi:hypothetical protein
MVPGLKTRAALAVSAVLVPLCLAQSPAPPEEMGVRFSATVTESLFGTATATTSGLHGQIYFLEPQTLALPRFAKLQPVGSIYTDTLYIPPREFSEGFPGVTDRFEWFAIDYTGSFYVSNPGRYRFVLISDDGSKLYIDDKVVVNNDGHHPPMRKDGAAKLAKGVHRIRVSYFQGPRNQIALVLGVRKPSDSEWRVFNTKEFLPPASSGSQ